MSSSSFSSENGGSSLYDLISAKPCDTHVRNQNTSTSSEMSDEETCNGEKFLRCYNADQEAIDDLADFIECKKWRDYSSRHLYLGRRQWSKRQESALRLHGAKMKVNSSSRRGNKKKQRKVHK